MAHEMCTGGCEGVSDTTGVCQAENCPKHNQPLEECTCSDGLNNRETNSEEEKIQK